MIRALLLGDAPTALPFTYVKEAPYDAVVIGSLTLTQLLRFREEAVFSALAEETAVRKAWCCLWKRAAKRI